MTEKRTCENCKYSDFPTDETPCRSCVNTDIHLPWLKNWTPKEEDREKESEKFTYFVSYKFLDRDKGKGIANDFAKTSRKITTEEDVLNLKKAVEESNNLEMVALIFWQLLEG